MIKRHTLRLLTGMLALGLAGSINAAEANSPTNTLPKADENNATNAFVKTDNTPKEGLLKVGNTTIGGHLKLQLYDVVNGTRKGSAVTNQIGRVTQETGTGLADDGLFLDISSQLNDKTSLDLELVFNAAAGATPQIGQNIGAQKVASPTATLSSITKASIKVILPHDYEVSAGILQPRYTWDYGAEMFWQEEMNVNQAVHDVGVWHDAGVEIYKNYDLGKVSLPTYLYLLNGNSSKYVDNNNGKTVLLHVEPAVGMFTFLGSAGAGTYDTDLYGSGSKELTRYAAGIMAAITPAVTLRSEYMSTDYADAIDSSSKAKVQPTFDAKATGYYIKLLYRYASWGQAILDYSAADLKYGGSPAAGTATQSGTMYKTLTPSLQFFVTESSEIIFQYDIADWHTKDNTDKLSFNRATLGWRTTF